MTHLTDSTSRIQERSYSIILETFERRLRLGELRVGDKLPSERALAEKHGISRPSVREALRILNALGLIRSSSGSGPKSGAIVISEPSDTLSWALRMHIATRNLPVKDVVSTRLLLEGPAARAAANAPDSPNAIWRWRTPASICVRWIFRRSRTSVSISAIPAFTTNYQSWAETLCSIP